MGRRLHERYEQLPLWPAYHVHATGDEFPTLWQAAKACGKVTFDPSAELVKYSECDPGEDEVLRAQSTHSVIRPTIFSQIAAVSPACKPLLRPMLRDAPGRGRESLSEIAKVGILAIQEHLSATLEDRHYVMPHSAGWDSRIVSLLLRDYLPSNRVHLVTWEPEAEQARLIARSLRLGRILVQSGRDDYFARFLRDFAFLGKSVSDPVRWMGGFHWLSWISWPHDTAGVSALFADESMGWAAEGKGTLAHFLAQRMLDNPSPMAARTRDWILPFASKPWLDVLTTYNLGAIEKEENCEKVRIYPLFNAADTLKREMIRQLDPKLLEFPNPRYELAKRTRPPHNEVLEHTKLSGETRERMLTNLARSIYHRELNEVRGISLPDHVSPYCPWLREYTTAAIIEACVNEGVEVTV